MSRTLSKRLREWKTFAREWKTFARGKAPLILAWCLLVGVAALAGPLAGPATAGDNAAIFNLEPEEVEADPGETVELDVVASSHGSLHGYGLGEVAFTVRYDPGLVSEATVDHETWLADGGGSAEEAEINGSAAVDESEGLISVAQEREPAGDGVTGTGAVATITLTVEEDAEPTNLEVAFENGSAILSTGDPQTVWDNEATVFVDGGVDEDEDEGEDLDGVTLGDDADLSGDEEEGDEGESVSTPGFGPLAALLAVFGVGAVLWLGRSSG